MPYHIALSYCSVTADVECILIYCHARLRLFVQFFFGAQMHVCS